MILMYWVSWGWVGYDDGNSSHEALMLPVPPCAVVLTVHRILDRWALTAPGSWAEGGRSMGLVV